MTLQIILFWNQSTWVKKHGNEDFDIPMGCYDGAEICKLVSIYIQSKLCKLMTKKDFRLYRDDRLGILRNTSGPEADCTWKSITNVFKECGLSITCGVNKKIVDFYVFILIGSTKHRNLTESQITILCTQTNPLTIPLI